MLQKLHERIKGWIAYVIIGLLCLVFVLWGIEYYVAGTHGDGKVLAEVDGKKVTDKTVDALVKQLQHEVSAAGTPLTEAVNQQIKAMALQKIIAEIALSQAAVKAGFIVEKSQLQQVILQTPAFQAEGRFSPALFQQFLMQSGMSEQQTFAELELELLINQVANGIQASNFALPNELAQYYRLFYQQREFNYLVVPQQKFASTIKVTPAMEHAYYVNNSVLLRMPEKLKIEYIQLSPQQISQHIQVSDASVKNYYQDNLQNYRKPKTWVIQRITVPVANTNEKTIAAARAKTQALVARLQKGVSFATLFQQEQGVKQTLNANAAEPAVLQALQNLQPGQISAPFNSAAGYSIIRLVTITPAVTQSFAEVKKQIKNGLLQQKIQQMMTKMNDALTSLTYTNPDSLQPAANALHVPIQTSDFFTADGAKTGIAANPQVVTAAFSKEVLQQKNNSNPITLADGSVLVLRVKQYIPSVTPPLADLQASIRRTLVQRMAQAQAALLANQLQQAIVSGQKPSAIAQQQHLSWVLEKNIQQDNKTTTIPSAVMTAAFHLSLGKGRDVAVAALPNGDSAVVQLMAVHYPDFKQLDAKRVQQLRQQMQQFFANLQYQLYMIGVKDTAKIKINE